MPLNELDFPPSLNTGSSSAIDLLFSPALKTSCTYQVAVAYFSSAWISDAAPGLSEFVANGGRLRWIMTPEMSADDVRALDNVKNIDAKSMVVWSAAEKLLYQMQYQPRQILSWLIADGILEVKFAIHKNPASIFHAKIGYFEDAQGGLVAFSGSYNQTGGANRNWERIDIYGRKDEPARADSIVNEWNDLWNGTDRSCDVIPLTEAVIQVVKNTAPGVRPYRISRKKVSRPPNIKLRPYQEEAIQSWFANRGTGMFVMATGTGKTITALALIADFCQKVLKTSNRMLVVVAVPYKHLLDQWCSDAEAFGFNPVKCYESKNSWYKDATSLVADLNVGARSVGMLAVTYSSLRRGAFKQVLESSNVDVFFVGDEIHNVEAEHTKSSLPESVKFKLGLTATPERSSGTDEGEVSLSDYFGKKVYEFGIEKAIQSGYLTPYKYYLQTIRLTDDEFDFYVDLSERILRLIVRDSPSTAEKDTLNKLLIRRARILGDAHQKYVRLRAIFPNDGGGNKSLIYCSDYSEDNSRPVDKVLKMIGGKGLHIRKFTHEESLRERGEIIEDFAKSRLDAVAAVRCLDEGVDIPSVDVAYMLASSTNLRQFVQRRGRVLRLSPGKPFATIHDFVCLPPERNDFNDAETRAAKSLVSRELDRIFEFSRLALNYSDSTEIIENIKEYL